MTQFFLQTAWLIPCYPFIGAVLAILWFPGIIRRTGPRPAGYINMAMTFIAFVQGIFALSATWNQPPQQIFIPWLQVANLNLTIPLEISSVTIGAVLAVTGINLLAQIYAIGYMEMDWGLGAFLFLAGIF